MKRITAITIVAIAFLGCSYVGASNAAISASVAMAMSPAPQKQATPEELLQAKIDLAIDNFEAMYPLDCEVLARWAMTMKGIGDANLKGFVTSCESGIIAASDKELTRDDYIDSLDKLIKYSGETDVKKVDALIAYSVISQMAFDEVRDEEKH